MLLTGAVLRCRWLRPRKRFPSAPSALPTLGQASFGLAGSRAHRDPRMNAPARLLAGLRQRVEPHPPVVPVPVDVTALVAPRHDIVSCAAILDANLPSHAEILRAWRPVSTTISGFRDA